MEDKTVEKEINHARIIRTSGYYDCYEFQDEMNHMK